MRTMKVWFIVALVFISYLNFVHANGGGGKSRGSGGGSRVDVKFDISHSCAYRVRGVRPFITGLARHWDPKGNLRTDYFRHEAGNEKAFFSAQPTGSSCGDARIILGLSTCSNCYTGMKYYTVTRGMQPIRMTMGFI